MKKVILFAAVALMLTACGAGGTNGKNASKNIPTDGILGELPKVVAEYAEKEAALVAEGDKLAKNEESRKKNEAKLEELFKQLLLLTKECKDKVAELTPGLAGKEIPVEAAEGLPLKFNGNLVLDEKRNAMCEGEFTADDANDGFAYLQYKVMLFDTDGKPIYVAPKGINVPRLERGKTGTKFSINIYLRVEPWNAAGYGRLAKAVVADRTRDDVKAMIDELDLRKKNFGKTAEEKEEK